MSVKNRNPTDLKIIVIGLYKTHFDDYGLKKESIRISIRKRRLRRRKSGGAFDVSTVAICSPYVAFRII